MFGNAFPVMWTRVLLHGSFGDSKSLAMVVSPGRKWQEGTSTRHTSEDSVLSLEKPMVLHASSWVSLETVPVFLERNFIIQLKAYFLCVSPVGQDTDFSTKGLPSTLPSRTRSVVAHTV